MDLRDDRRDLWSGFGDGLARAFEFAVTPAIFAGIGLFIDRRIELFPVFTIALLVFALVGMFVRMWFGYDAQMKAHEARGSWQPRSAAHDGPRSAA